MKFVKGLLFKLLAMLVFLVALLAAVDNSDEVSLSFLEYSTPLWPISYWVLSAFVCGVLFSYVMNTWTNARLRLAAKKAMNLVDQTNRDLDLLKSGDLVKAGDLVRAGDIVKAEDRVVTEDPADVGDLAKAGKVG